MTSPLAFVFPGQGSQIVGMGRAVYEASARARAVFEDADRILGYKLSEICFNGPSEKLDDTRVAQPAILTTSVALLEALAEDAGHAPGRISDGHEPRGVAGLPDELRPSFVAGHSLGEFSALVAGLAQDDPRLARVDGEEVRPEAGRLSGHELDDRGFEALGRRAGLQVQRAGRGVRPEHRRPWPHVRLLDRTGQLDPALRRDVAHPGLRGGDERRIGPVRAAHESSTLRSAAETSRGARRPAGPVSAVRQVG